MYITWHDYLSEESIYPSLLGVNKLLVELRRASDTASYRRHLLDGMFAYVEPGIISIPGKSQDQDPRHFPRLFVECRYFLPDCKIQRGLRVELTPEDKGNEAEKIERLIGEAHKDAGIV